VVVFELLEIPYTWCRSGKLQGPVTFRKQTDMARFMALVRHLKLSWLICCPGRYMYKA
jgi:hypothetical protein